MSSTSKEDFTIAKPEVEAAREYAPSTGGAKAGDDNFEVFKKDVEGGEAYRTNGWIKTFWLFFKTLFSTGVLSIPAIFAYVGSVPGCLLIIFWGLFNTYSAFVIAGFRTRHAGMHGIQDMAYLVGGVFYRELVGGLFLIGFVLVMGSGVIATSTALNALSDHAICTVWFGFIAFIISTGASAFPRFSQISIFAAAGCISIYVAVLTVVIAVAVQDRPALAPATGDFELGYQVIAHSDFIGGMTACLVIFVSSSGSSAFIPMIAEMRNPKDYKKPIVATMTLLNVSYLVFALVVYKYCGTWIAPVALGSAGPLIKKIAFGIGLPGILFSTMVNQHIAAKYLFVRILRDTEHLQRKTKTHWVTWIGCVGATGTVGFLIAQAVPFFGTLLSVLAAIAYTPLAIIFPMTFWLWDFAHYRKGTATQKLIWSLHLFMACYGTFQAIAGSYSSIQSIVNQYAAGTVDKAFSCADNS